MSAAVCSHLDRIEFTELPAPIEGVYGVPEDRQPLGAHAHVHGVRNDRLLRRLIQQARVEARPRGLAPDHRVGRAGRGLELVLHRQPRVRTGMIALDGNAIAGELLEAVGVDLTAATCVRAACRMSSVVASAIVYMRGAGRVARCRGCTKPLPVLVTIRAVTCVDLHGIAGFEMKI